MSKITLKYADGVRYARYPLPLHDTNAGYRTAQQDPTEQPEQELHVWPNPATDHLLIELTNASERSAEWELLDMQGRTIHTDIRRTDDGRWSMDLGTVGSGTYLLLGISGTEQWQTKVLVLP